MKVLVIEDNPMNRKLFRLIIESLGHLYLDAEDGEAGVATARREAPDLILMDIQMPVLDGISALHLLREDDGMKDIPVLAVTSYAMKGDRDRFLAEGFDGYIEKPISKDRFIATIRKYDLLKKT